MSGRNSQAPPLNLLVIVADTFRRDHLGGGSAGSLTPRLDEFAAGGIRFTQGFSGSYPTLPCRAEIFTGSYVFTYLNWGPLPPRVPVLAETLAEAGYTCTMVTDNLPLCRSGYGYDRGFHNRIRVRGQWYDNFIAGDEEIQWPCSREKLAGAMNGRVEQYLRNVSIRRREEDWFAPQVVERAADWLGREGGRTPFYLHVDIFDPHEPWDPPAADAPRSAASQEGEDLIYPLHPSASQYSAADLARMRELYAGEVRLVDRWVGRLLDELERLGLASNTLVFFLSDHGILLGERGLVGKMARKSRSLRGWPLYPEIAEIPFLIRLPGAPPAVRHDFVQPVDLPATVYSLLGVTPPPSQAGRRLLTPSGEPLDPPRDLCVSSWSLRGFSVHRPSVIRDAGWSLVYWRSGVRPELYRRDAGGGEREDCFMAHQEEARRLHRGYVEFLRRQRTAPHQLLPRSVWTGPMGDTGGRHLAEG